MVKNILKDGTVIEDLTGYVVTKEACPEVYKFMERFLRMEEAPDNRRQVKRRKDGEEDQCGH